MVYITSQNDTLPIWYFKRNLGIHLFEKKSITYFMSMIERNKFGIDYEHFGNNIGFMEYFKKQLLLSKIIYLPDQFKLLDNRYSNYDPILSVKGYINIDISNAKVIYQSHNNPYEFVTKSYK